MRELARSVAFVCPIDRQRLIQRQGMLVCAECATEFPVIDGVPILINDANSVFRIADYAQGRTYEGASGYGGSIDRTAGWRRAYRRMAYRLAQAEVLGPGIDAIDYILSRQPEARILVVGAGERRYAGDVTYTDVALSPNVDCICDAHDLPFPDESFDAVFADSVLEHVCDPQRCVAEFVRVLKPRGYVMAITPFLQSVHMGAHDFTRFTYLGHRRLFRRFDDVQSGMCGGPGYAAMHMIRNLATTLTNRPRLRALLRLLALLVTYPMRYLDRFLSRHESAYNSACAFYFFGQKRDVAIADRDILTLFRGR